MYRRRNPFEPRKLICGGQRGFGPLLGTCDCGCAMTGLDADRVRRKRNSQNLQIPNRGDKFTLAVNGTASGNEGQLDTINLCACTTEDLTWLGTTSDGSYFSGRSGKTLTL